MRDLGDIEAVSALARAVLERKVRLKEKEKAYKEAIAEDEKALEAAEQALRRAWNS